MPGLNDAHVAKRAYEIWEREGRPHGRDREHWLQAVEELSTTIVADPVVLKPAKAATPKAAEKPAVAEKPVAQAKPVMAAKPVMPAKSVAAAVTAPARTKATPKKK